MWSLAARILGPSDLWHQTQPKTVSYTTDIIVNGGNHWILPIERGELPATKPPLYNWLAVPAVKVAGFNSEVAHKLPSVLSLIACWWLVARVGRRLDAVNGRRIGWLAAMMFASNYTMFKLGYLARPDMLLTLWLLIAWASATAIVIETSTSQQVNKSTEREWARSIGEVVGGTDGSPRSVYWLIVAFWGSVALAALTKGPPAIVGVIYGAAAARMIGGSWRVLGAFKPLLGIAICSAIFGLWVYGVWRINPEHVQQVLWQNEIFGRFTGTGPEGNQEGLRGWFRTLPEFVVYYLFRLAPWSVFSVAAMYTLWRRRGSGLDVPSSTTDSATVENLAWRRGSAMLVLLVVGVFTLSTSKRADYIAVTFAPGSLLAAWWLTSTWPAIRRHVWWAVPTIAVMALTAMTAFNQLESVAPSPGFGDQVKRFIDRATDAMRDEPLPVYFSDSGAAHLQAMLGSSQLDRDRTALMWLMKERRAFWVVAGERAVESDRLDLELKGRRKTARIEAKAQTLELPRTDSWPGQVTLWRVEWPAPRRAHPRESPLNSSR